MSEKQSEARRLADALEQGNYLLSVERDATAAELRRLDEVSRELLEALTPFVLTNSSEEFVTLVVRSSDIARARAAITNGNGGDA